MELGKVGKVTCLYCGSDAPKAIKGFQRCENCGAKVQKLTIHTVNKPFDSRRAFAEDKRPAQPL